MKAKTFILTFLMMMSSTFLFGQNVLPGGYNMTITSEIILDGVPQTNTDYLVYAMHDGTVLGQSSIMKEGPDEYITEPLYYVNLEVEGNSGDVINFKLVADGKTYISSTEVDYEDNAMLGNLEDLWTIEFKTVAQIGDVVYPSLQKAIDAAANGYVVTLLKNNAENVTVVQAPNVAFTIEGAEKTMSGTITVNGKSAAYATAGLTIKNVNFDATNIDDASIMLGVSGDNNTRYTNGVTVQDCDFEGNGQTKVAIKNYTGGCKNLTVTGGNFTGLHSLMQVKGVDGLTITGVTVEESGRGISVGTSTNVAISNSTFDVNSYGVRADGSGAYEMTLTDNTISAELPVVVRNAEEVAYNLTIAGNNNSFTAKQQGNNPEGYQVVFTTGDDGTYLAPTTGQFLLSVPENFNVYPVYVAQVGEYKYMSVVTAINEAADGATVQLLPGTIEEYVYPWPESNHSKEKSITIIGAENFGTTLTGGMYLGYDDSQCRNHTIVVEGIAFEGKGLTVACQENVTIKNNKFNNITDTRAIAVIGKEIKATVENNKIDGVQIGIELRNMAVATMTGNEVKNTTHNSVQVTAANPDADVTITDNTFENWGEEGEGRAIRVSGGDNIVVNNNKMVNDNAPESYVKITKVTETETQTIDVDKNYWNGNNPLALFETDGTNDPVSYIKGYYSDSDMNMSSYITLAPSVAKIGDVYYQSLQAAINAATEGQTVTVINDVELENTVTVAAGKVVTLDLNGKTVSGISNVASTTAVILNKGNLTVKTSVEGGKITTQALQPDTNWGGEGEPPYPTYANNTIRNEGTFTLVSGRIENMSPAGGATYAIDNYNGSTTNIDGGEVYCENNLAIRLFCGDNISLNIDGGKIQGTRALWIQLANSNSSVAPNVEVNISDGEIRATGETSGYIQALYSYSYGNDMKNVEINISGGTFYGDINLTGGNNKTNIETLNISGGTFNGNEYDINSYGADEKAVGAISITGGTFSKNYAEKYALDNGFVFVENSNGTYKLEEFDGFEIPNLDRLIAFRNAVNAGNTFAGQTVTVTADIDLDEVANWTPIGTLENPFNGTFDGGNKTISNLNVNGGAYVGLFGYADNATIKNVKINNANVEGTNCVGVIAGDVYSTSLIDNCHVSGSIKVEGQTNVGGIVGKYYTKVTNSSVIGDGVATSYVKGVHYAADYEGDNIGGIMGHGGENNTFTNNTVKNITISGTRKVGGIVGVTDQNTDVTNCLVENVNIETTATAEYASANAAIAGHASIVGSYTKLGTNNNGTVTNCVVKNVTFVNNNNVTMSAGPITGGAREGMIDPTGVTASGNLVYMSTIIGNTTNMYLMKAVAKIEETNYYTLDEAIAAANNQTVTVLENVELRNTLTIEAGKTVTLDLNGKTINTAWEDESAEKHYYAFDNKGTLTITDSSTEANGVINARGNFNYGTLTLEEGTINAIDHNGGYGVRNYEGSKFTMNGGLIATTYENGDEPGDGYDATTVRVDSGAEFIMNGGEINNISNYTFAIDNYGTTTIKENAGEVKSVHTTLANYGTMTISAGTFICNGLEGVTAHALWADEGTTIINGGTFDGKDNYNGFNVCASAGAVVEINGGKFESVHSGSLYGDGTITVKGGTFFDEVKEERLAPGYVCKQNTDGTYGVFLGVAKIVETDVIYASLQAAVNAATTSQNIVLLADINETFTILKKVTIDGGGYNSTGLIEVKPASKNSTITFKNFSIKDSDAAGFVKPNGNAAYYIFEDITVEGGYGIVNGNKVGNSATFKDVTITGTTYGVGRFVAVNDVILEDVQIEGAKYGVHIRNHGGGRTVTFKNSNIDATYPMYIDDQDTYTYTITFKFEGVNTLTGTISENTTTYGKYVLAEANAKLTAQEGLNVTTTVEGCVVEYEAGETPGFGTYSVVAANVALYHGEELVKQFATIQDAIDAAENGDKVVVLEDVDLSTNQFVTLDNSFNTYFKVEGKAVTIDLNGKIISGEYDITSPWLVGVFSTDNNGHLTLEDNVGTAKVDITGVNGEVYALIANYESGCSITINGGTYILDDVYYGNGSAPGALVWSSPSAKDDEGIRVNGGNFHLGNVATGSNASPWIFNVNGNNSGHIKVFGGTYNYNVFNQYWVFEVQTTKEYAIRYDGDETDTWTVVPAVAWVNNQKKSGGNWYTYELGYTTLAEAIAAAEDCNRPDFAETVTLLEGITLENTITVNAGKDVILDLNGKTISGVCNSGQGHMFMVQNTADLTVKDSSENKNGKITYARGTSNTGWVIDLEGDLILESGTIELTGDSWSIGYAVDVRPNSWGSKYTEATTFTMNGGKLVSSDAAVRVASSSADDHENVSANFIMNGGEIEAKWDGIFVQQSNAAYDILNVRINGGNIKSELSPLRLYGPAATSVLNNVENPITLNITGGTFDYTGSNLEDTRWLVPGVIMVYGGATFEQMLDYTDFEITGGTFDGDVNDYCAEGFAAVDNGNETWKVMPVQEQTLPSGWSWYSSYLDIELSDLTNAIGDNGVQIKNQEGIFKQYNDNLGIWSGILSEIDLSDMYMVNVKADQTLKVAAPLAVTEEYTITINPGWNWIGYPSNVNVDINTVLALLTPETNDLIKTQHKGYAQFNYNKWRGGLKTMLPGEGYMYYSNANTTKTFVYTVEATRGTVEANVTAENNYWTPDATKYPFNMTMTAVVDGLTDANYEVAAFVNGEVRGSARPIYIEEIDAYVLFLTIHGEDVEEMSFRLYDIDNDTEYDLSDRINYSNDAHLGSVNEPYVFSRGTTGIGESAMSEVNIYPNPTTTGTEINLQATCDTVEVFNALGVKVAEYQNVDTIDALETAGIYVIRITNDGNVQNCRLVVK